MTFASGQSRGDQRRLSRQALTVVLTGDRRPAVMHIFGGDDQRFQTTTSATSSPRLDA